MIKRLRVGIVGCGGAGRAQFWRFENETNVEVAAIFDPKPAAVAEFFSRSHVATPPRVTNDWGKFLSTDGLDVVSICSPDHEHARQAIDCFKRGLHVLVEKPMATSAADGLRMIEAANAAGRKLMVHHQMRFLPVFRITEEHATKGAIGRIFGMEADYYHDLRQRATQYDDWRIQPASCPNIVFGGACHPLDLMQWASRSKIEEVFAYANHDAFKAFPDVDTVMALLKFSSGAIGRMTMTIGCNRPSEHTLVLLGDGGTIANGLLLRTEREDSGSLVRHFPKLAQRVWLRVNRQFRLVSDQEARMINYPVESINFLRRWLGRIVMVVGDVLAYPYSQNEHGTACKELIAGFLDSVRNDTPVAIDPLDSLDTLRVCEAVIQSYRTGMSVRVARR